ncbi:MAG: hypothetical protein C6P35_10935 [Cohnella sp.]|jgi:hypothetical protein|nr:MAG: hypothetical protein C6P35_10935 [Cohnella sp.]
MGKRLLACVITIALLFIVMVLNASDESSSLASFSNTYVIGTAIVQLSFFYFFIACPISVFVDNILHRRNPSGKALIWKRGLGHTVSGIVVGWLLSYPLNVLPEYRLNFVAGCCLLMLLMLVIDMLLSLRIRK